MYAIVETTDRNNEKEVSIVCKNWIKGTNVFWPDNKNIKRLLETNAAPKDTWQKYPFKLLQNNIQTLSEAKKRERMFEIFSNSDSEMACTQKKQFKIIDLNNQYDEVPQSNNITTFLYEDDQIQRENEAILYEGEVAFESTQFLTFNENNNENLGEVQRCNATVGQIVEPTVAESNSPDNDSQTNPTNSEMYVTELFKEIKDLKDQLVAMESNLNSKLISMENTIKPIVNLLPELISFVRKNANNSIEKHPSFNLPSLPFSSVADVEAFNLKLIDMSYSNQIVGFPIYTNTSNTY